MTIYQLASSPITEPVAYVLGLVFPLFIDKKEVFDKFNGKKYAAGCVNYNSNMVTDSALAEHFRIVNNLCKKIDCQIKTNGKDKYRVNDFSCSPKKGFSCLIDTTGVSKEQCEIIFRNLVKDIKVSDNFKLKSTFIRACFDGRGSWDTTLHCFSVDIDRKVPDKTKRCDQFLIKSICDSVLCGDAVQINQRDWVHKKNDQLRIRKNYLRKFLTSVDLYSIARKQILMNGLNDIGI